ncbi:MAG TPA: hypothetical protein VFF07_04825 [Actinomycetota bacterium]|nr:hypothetical protein [Actinomycetota bacterium]
MKFQGVGIIKIDLLVVAAASWVLQDALGIVLRVPRESRADG